MNELSPKRKLRRGESKEACQNRMGVNAYRAWQRLPRNQPVLQSNELKSKLHSESVVRDLNANEQLKICSKHGKHA